MRSTAVSSPGAGGDGAGGTVTKNTELSMLELASLMDAYAGGAKDKYQARPQFLNPQHVQHVFVEDSGFSRRRRVPQNGNGLVRQLEAERRQDRQHHHGGQGRDRETRRAPHVHPQVRQDTARRGVLRAASLPEVCGARADDAAGATHQARQALLSSPLLPVFRYLLERALLGARLALVAHNVRRAS